MKVNGLSQKFIDILLIFEHLTRRGSKPRLLKIAAIVVQSLCYQLN